MNTGNRSADCTYGWVENEKILDAIFGLVTGAIREAADVSASKRKLDVG